MRIKCLPAHYVIYYCSKFPESHQRYASEPAKSTKIKIETAMKNRSPCPRETSRHFRNTASHGRKNAPASCISSSPRPYNKIMQTGILRGMSVLAGLLWLASCSSSPKSRDYPGYMTRRRSASAEATPGTVRATSSICSAIACDLSDRK